MTSSLDAEGQTITRDYDDLSRLTDIVSPDNSTTFGYDAVGNRLSAVDADSNISFTYDELNRVATANSNAGGLQPTITLAYTYDAVGNRRQLQDSLGSTTDFDFDRVGRLTRLTSAANNVVNLAYDPAGRLQRIDYPNTVVSEIIYGLDGRVQSISDRLELTELKRFDYVYRSDGLISGVTESVGFRSFAYDGLQQVTDAGFGTAPESYGYDEAGNRTVSHISTGHQLDSANRLLADDQFSYTYDANGSLVTKTDIATAQTTTYGYDGQNQLVRIDFPNGNVATYAYDAFGRRIEKSVDGVVTRYVYDDDNIIMEFDGTNTLIARYSHGDQVDQPLVLERGGQSFFYHSDFLGSIHGLTDENGSFVNEYAYDAYGNFELRTEAVTNPFTFTSREFDPESGLYYYRARYYDANSGRFISEDPIGFASDDLNKYRYVFNSPTNLADPYGLGVKSTYARLVVFAKNALKSSRAWKDSFAKRWNKRVNDLWEKHVSAENSLRFQAFKEGARQGAAGGEFRAPLNLSRSEFAAFLAGRLAGAVGALLKLGGFGG